MHQPWYAQPTTAKRELGLAPPPRDVTSRAFWSAALGTGPQIAWLVCLFLTLFVVVFALDSEAVTLVEFRGPMETTSGVVESTYPTSSSENKRRIYGAEYSYSARGRERTGTSFGKSVPGAGTKVDVEFLVARPEASRIVGMRRRVFGIFGVAPALAFVVALFIAVRLSIQGVGRARLLRTGQLGYAKLVEKKPTGSRVNKQPVIAYTFEVDLPAEAVPAAYRGQWQSWAKTHRFTFKTHQGSKLEDDPLEPVLYDPDRVGSGFPLDHLDVEVTPAGGVHAQGYAPAVRFLMPVLVVVALVAGTYLGWR